MSDASCRRRGTVRLALATIVVVGAACRVSPNFVRPSPPLAPRYADAIAALRSAMDSTGQHVAMGGVVSLRWWEAFRSPELDATVDQAIGGSPTIASAQASLAQARDLLSQVRGGHAPSVDASASTELQQNGGSSGGARRIGTLLSAGSLVSYPADVFGGIRRQIEQQGALADEAQYSVAATYLAVTGNTVSAAISIASLRAQLQALDEILRYDRQNLDLVKAKVAAGKAARIDILSAETQLETDGALVPPIREQLAASRHALSVLAGRLPSEWSPPDFDLDCLMLPGELPVSIPSDLVRQRPDILTAEAHLHAAGAAIGVAGAQLYPSMTLTASLVTQASSAVPLFQGPSALWSLLNGATAPIFRGGALRAQRRAAVDAYDATFAVYRQTVLSAFQQVADVLNALAQDNQLADAQSRTLAASRELLDLQRTSYDAGKSNMLQLIDAQRSYEQARLGRIRAVAAVYQDAAELAVAMGGGWWQASSAQAREWGTRAVPQRP